MAFVIKPPISPMEAELVDEIPEGAGWQYEPKWDGFRCLAFRDHDTIYLQSKAEKPLTRYFPELVAALKALKARRFVLDGEIVVPVAGRLAFDELLQRIHPAESRVRRLAAERPALLIAFDLLADARGKNLMALPLRERRAALEAFAKQLGRSASIRLSPATRRRAQARQWFRSVGGNLDGVVAKRLDRPYRAGERDAVVKIKLIRSADCVVGGFRYGARGKLVGSLLLGLYDDDGLLHHVGYTSSIKDDARAALTAKLEKLVKPPGFTGRAPGGPSRWNTKRSSEWQPLAPKLVVEVAFDHFTSGRFRHGTTFLRWRPDKAPRQCTLAQAEHQGGADLDLLDRDFRAARRKKASD
jgi:ATP-dependent DNA ligase